MGTPRPLESVDQMRNVQRIANCGGVAEHQEADERECRSREIKRGEIVITVAADVALTSDPPILLKSWDAGADCLVEVTQHDLFAQHPGLHVFCAGESEMTHVRADP